jgi:hypothetical protein
MLKRGAEEVQRSGQSDQWTDTGSPEIPVPPPTEEAGPPWTAAMPGDNEGDAWLDERPPPRER